MNKTGFHVFSLSSIIRGVSCFWSLLSLNVQILEGEFQLHYLKKNYQYLLIFDQIEFELQLCCETLVLNMLSTNYSVQYRVNMWDIESDYSLLEQCYPISTYLWCWLVYNALRFYTLLASTMNPQIFIWHMYNLTTQLDNSSLGIQAMSVRNWWGS